MAKNEGGFFWGVLLGAIAAAIAGCLVLTRSSRTFPIGAGTAKSPAKRVPQRKAMKARSAAVKKK
jgi:gas vesicle protein